MDENNHKQLMLTLLRDWAAAKGTATSTCR